MNCPSRTDDSIEHPDWNQNPPSLAPDLTTRQDLNGISNARELLDRAGLVGVSFAGWDETGIAAFREGDPEKERPLLGGASLTQSGRSKSETGTAGLLDTPQNYSNRSWQIVKEWARWVLSVAIVSAVISHVRPGKTTVRYLPEASSRPIAIDAEEDFLRMPKRSTCEKGGVGGDEYDLPLHVAGLFIILSVSTLACAFPILAVWFPRLRIPPAFLFFVTHFGTGVLIATAFVHLLPTAFTSLNDPCLSGFWTNDYPAMPGAISLAGIFLVTVIEMVFSPARHCCRPRLDERVTASSPPREDSPVQMPRIDVTEPPNSATNPREPAAMLDGRHLSDLGPLAGRSSSMSRSINRMGEENEGITRVPSAPDEPSTFEEKKTETLQQDVERSDDNWSLSPELKEKRSLMQVVLLEMGILFHSVFIGMSLSVSVGNSFVILLIAIVFHRMSVSLLAHEFLLTCVESFEGLALGARISSLNWPRRAYQPWLMSLAYGCTTPIGQAIGLATHTLYSPDSEVGLLVVGTMNAISAGLLIFASLVELMSEDFLSDESWRVLRGKKRVIACLLVFAGAFCMSLVGAWA